MKALFFIEILWILGSYFYGIMLIAPFYSVPITVSFLKVAEYSNGFLDPS
jgi:hypothetical protein